MTIVFICAFGVFFSVWFALELPYFELLFFTYQALFLNIYFITRYVNIFTRFRTYHEKIIIKYSNLYTRKEIETI